MEKVKLLRNQEALENEICPECRITIIRGLYVKLADLSPKKPSRTRPAQIVESPLSISSKPADLSLSEINSFQHLGSHPLKMEQKKLNLKFVIIHILSEQI